MDSLYASYDKQTIQIEEFFKQIKKNIIEARVCMSTNMDVIHAQEFFQSGITQHFLQLQEDRFDHVEEIQIEVLW